MQNTKNNNNNTTKIPMLLRNANEQDDSINEHIFKYTHVAFF